MQQTPLTYKDGGAPTNLSFRWQLIQDKNGARNRKYILLNGPVEGEFLHDYVKKHGWTKYIVTTTQEGSVALIMESGGKRIQPPTGVQQGGPRGSVEASASAMLQSKGKVWTTLSLDTPTP